MCAKRAEAGKPGICPSGRVTAVLKKWPVAPVSIIVVGFLGGEGVDCVGVTQLLATVKLLAVGTGVTDPLNQE
jgi:hypothetical protein